MKVADFNAIGREAKSLLVQVCDAIQPCTDECASNPCEKKTKEWLLKEMEKEVNLKISEGKVFVMLLFVRKLYVLIRSHQVIQKSVAHLHPARSKIALDRLFRCILASL